MNIDTQTLKDALVQQAVQGAHVTNLFERLQQTQQELQQTKETLDKLAAERHETVTKLNARIAELVELASEKVPAVGSEGGTPD